MRPEPVWYGIKRIGESMKKYEIPLSVKERGFHADGTESPPDEPQTLERVF